MALNGPEVSSIGILSWQWDSYMNTCRTGQVTGATSCFEDLKGGLQFIIYNF